MEVPQNNGKFTFISYSHDTPEHKAQVRHVAEKLHKNSVTAKLDQYEAFPPEGWPAWMLRHINAAEFVLVVCTPTYYKRSMGLEAPQKGAGAAWESLVITQQLYDAYGKNTKYIPVIFDDKHTSSIPLFLKAYTYYNISTDDGFIKLLRLLTRQPEYIPHPLGQPPLLPPINSFPTTDFPAFTPQTFTFSVPPPSFTGRTDELAKLDAALWGRGNVATVIHGLPGVGKSTLANEYARLHIDRYAAVLPISAETETGIIESLRSFGVRHVPNFTSITDHAAAAQQVIASVLPHFSQEKAKPILLIFDNLEDERFLHKWHTGAKTQVLVTSRNNIYEKNVVHIPLDTWPIQDAVAYLQTESERLELGKNNQDAELIATALGCLPLALAHAAAYLKRKRAVKPSTYLQRINEHLANAPQGTRYEERAVFATFQEAILQVEQKTPGATSIICFAAFFSSDAIPEELFKQNKEIYAANLQPPMPQTLNLHLAIDNLENALSELDRFSLISFSGNTRTFHIHSLLQATAQNLLGSKRVAWIKCAIDAANAAFPAPPDFIAWPQCERLVQHAQAAINAFPEDELFSHIALLANQCGYYLSQINRYTEAEPLYRRALAIHEQSLPAGHPDIAIALNNLATLLDNTNRRSEAEPLYRRALAIREQSLPASHPDIAVALNNLATLLDNTNRRSEAEPLYRRALAIREQSLPAGHPDIALALNNLAYLLSATSRYAEAEPLHRRALAIREQSLPADHPDIAVSLNNLAALLDNINRRSEAEPLYRRALAIREQSLPAGHPDIAVALNNLATLLDNTNRRYEAEPLYRRALVVNEKSLPADHPGIATSLNNLAYLLSVTSRYVEAEPLHRRALAIREQNLPAGHPDIAISLNNLAALLDNTYRRSEAEPLYRRALTIREQSLPANHPDIAISLNNLATLLDNTNRRSEAEPLYRRALDISEKSLPADHPNIAKSLNNLAYLLSATNRNAEAEPLHRRALAIREQSLPAGHPDIAISLHNLADLLANTNRRSEAEPLYRRALDISEKSLPADHPNIANSLNNLAYLLSATNRNAEAEPLHRRALAIREQSLPADHPDIAISLNNLACLLYNTNRCSEAEPLYRRALNISEKSLPADHPNIACSLNNLAYLLTEKNRYIEAEPLYRRALAIREQNLSADHPDIAISLNNLACLLDRTERHEEACILFQKSHAINIKNQAP